MNRLVPSTVVEFIRRFGYGDGNVSYTRVQYLQVASILSMIEEISPSLITLDAENFAHFTVAREALSFALTRWKRETAGDGYYLRSEDLLERKHPITVIRDLLAKCPDSVLPEGSTLLAFLAASPDLKQELERDLASVETDVRGREWKSATLLGGATIEALLLWAMESANSHDPSRFTTAKQSLSPQPSKPAIVAWNLDELIRCAFALGLLDAKECALLSVYKDYRNLIHPGLALRKATPCGKETAHGVLSGAHLVIRKIERAKGTLF